jgi:cysteinyl-tRNA synthetase
LIERALRGTSIVPMAFRLHDSLSDATIPLPERTPGETSLYVCGPTVYGYIHVGNGRGPVVFDVLVRHLEAQGRKVRYARNYTDVDDKIIDTAVKGNEDPRVVAERFIAAYREDVSALGCREPTVEPRVSHTIAEIVALIEALIARGCAYVTPDGDVYYEVATFPDYGKLSKRRVEVQRSEYGRGKSGEGKRGEHDFALWKAAKPHEPAGARWASPWGEGRPGWHIECSAMTHAHLGDGFDIHGGGPDLKFPHHENEIAQSEPVYGAPLARAWMHHGFIEMDIERNAGFSDEVLAVLHADPELRKISKSDRVKLEALRARDVAALSAEEQALAAIYERKVRFADWFQLRRLRERVDGEAIRFWILGTHYRSPLAFDLVEEGGTVRFPAIEQAEKRLEYFYDTRVKLAARQATARPAGKPTPTVVKSVDELRAAFDAALDDDLNTAGALDPMGRLFARVNELCDARKVPAEDLAHAATALAHMIAVTGLGEGDAEAFFARVTARRVALRGLDRAHLDGLVAARTAARDAREFARADAIRAELTSLGVELRDGPSGTAWRAV